MYAFFHMRILSDTKYCLIILLLFLKSIFFLDKSHFFSLHQFRFSFIGIPTNYSMSIQEVSS